jgi:hypothetical protein
MAGKIVCLNVDEQRFVDAFSLVDLVYSTFNFAKERLRNSEKDILKVCFVAIFTQDA